MAVKLGYGGLANTNGARDFTGKEESLSTDVLHFRSNNMNRRRFGGMWYPLFLLWWVR